MIKTFEVQLLPTPEQLEQFAQHAGAVRWLWNYMLNHNVEKYKIDQKFAFRYEMSLMLPQLKVEYPWLKDVNSQSLQEQCINLNNALSRMFRSKKKPTKTKVGFPNFKSKHRHVDSFIVPQHFHICNTSIKLPKIGKVKFVKQRPFEGKAKQIIVKLKNHKWFAYVVCEVDDIPQIKDVVESEVVGIDVGISDFAILSNGTKVANPKFLNKSTKRLARQQRKLSRRKFGSKNRSKQRLIVNKIHKQITNRRNDFQWKTAHSIAKMSPVISMENLNIKGMIKNRKLAKHIADASWFSFKTKLVHQLSKRGGFVVNINRFAPSSKTCSSCGTIKTDLTLKDREWTCSACSSHHDRDINAAINIRQFGIIELYRLGTCRIYACGDNSSGLDVNPNETMSLNQEKVSPLGDPICS